jgi:hypothetical protein
VGNIQRKRDMMTVGTFQHSLSDAAPPENADIALQALWWAGKGNWGRAHGCAQQAEGNPDGDVVHAHLHRQEGDIANARYWYRRAGRLLPEVSLKEEWTAIAAQFLSRA